MGTFRAADLKPGDTFVRRGEPADVLVTVLGEQEPSPNEFGLPWFRYLARREDTGDTGYVIFGPTGVVNRP